ncbi:MAG: hypothetical protein IKN55_01180 [Oscillospiraceae bacterium]|nr:hypothetical protein [Oscillospiraceae bacterium]
MEILIGIIVIIVLLLVIGVNPAIIATGVLILIELLLLFMTGFFIVTLILLLTAKPVKAEFLRIMEHEVVGTYAIYKIDGEEYTNTFPAEIMFVDKIYHEGKIYSARLKKGKKKHLLFDWYSYIVIGVGLPLSAGLAALLGWLLPVLLGVFG